MDWWHAFIALDWATLGKTAIGAGFGTAATAGVFALYRDHRQKKSLAAYMAMRLAVILEAYAHSCAEFIDYNANAPHHSREDEFPAWKVTLPDLPTYPDDAQGWSSIDKKLAMRCLGLRNKIVGSQGIIMSNIEHDMDGLEDALNEQAAARGLEAWKLAMEFRGRYAIAAADTVWDFSARLEQTLRTAQKSAQDRIERQAEFLEELSAADRRAEASPT